MLVLHPLGQDFEAHPLVQLLSNIPTDLAGWAAVLLALTALAALIALDDKRKHARVAAAPSAGSSVVEAIEVEHAPVRIPDLAAIQADAALQIDAAEHAFNRMLAECAGIAGSKLTPTFEPLRKFAPQP